MKKKVKKVKVKKAIKAKPAKVKKPKPEKKKKLTVSKVCCSKCGDCKGMSKDRKDKLIAQFGTFEEVHKNYVCRKCRKELNVRKDGKVKPPKRTRKPKLSSTWEKDEKGEVILPDSLINWVPRERQVCQPAELAKINVCWRPDLWVEHKKIDGIGFCNGCRFFKDSCGDPSRRLVDEDKIKITKPQKFKKIKQTKKKKK